MEAVKALHKAISREDLAEVQRLVEIQGADIEVRYNSGATALLWACYSKT